LQKSIIETSEIDMTSAALLALSHIRIDI